MRANLACALKTTLLASICALSGCDQADSSTANARTISIEHAQGTTSVPLHPQKVIVFDPAILDTMDALNISVAGVPQTSSHLPDYLAKYRGGEYLNAGTLFEPDYEALSGAKPDLIIAGGRATDAYAKLSGIAPTISLDVDSKNYMASFSQRMEQLGAIFGKEEEAKTQLAGFKRQIAQTREKAANAGTALVLMISGGRMSAYGPGSRFGFVFDELGFKPAAEFPAAGAGRHGNVVTSEFLLSVNPDWLFVLDRDNAIGRTSDGAQSARQVLDNALIHKTNAWQQNRIVYLDSTSIYISAGLQSYQKLIADVNTALDKK